jgi:hypothetical protein
MAGIDKLSIETKGMEAHDEAATLLAARALDRVQTLRTEQRLTIEEAKAYTDEPN